MVFLPPGKVFPVSPKVWWRTACIPQPHNDLAREIPEGAELCDDITLVGIKIGTKKII